MSVEKLKEQIDKIDIYLLDQILKGRYSNGKKILDAGCGNGRNLKWFNNNDYCVYGVDSDISKIKLIQKIYPNFKHNFSVNVVEKLPHANDYFNHIICNAVLHFANSESHFFDMFTELIRVLKPTGTLYIRMASIFGLENNVIFIADGRYKLPDGTERFLLTSSILQKLNLKFNYTFIEPVKTVIVENKRCMTTLVLQKTNDFST